jgi:hypothetical protein
MNNSKIAGVMTPPTMGVTMPFITSVPIPGLKRTGTKPQEGAPTVLILRWPPFTAPYITAPLRSAMFCRLFLSYSDLMMNKGRFFFPSTIFSAIL